MEDGGGSIGLRRGSGGGGGVESKSSNALQASISNLFPKLASAKGAGHARIIQSGVVITEDKKSASISKEHSKPFSIVPSNLLQRLDPLISAFAILQSFALVPVGFRF